MWLTGHQRRKRYYVKDSDDGDDLDTFGNFNHSNKSFPRRESTLRDHSSTKDDNNTSTERRTTNKIRILPQPAGSFTGSWGAWAKGRAQTTEEIADAISVREKRILERSRFLREIKDSEAEDENEDEDEDEEDSPIVFPRQKRRNITTIHDDDDDSVAVGARWPQRNNTQTEVDIDEDSKSSLVVNNHFVRRAELSRTRRSPVILQRNDRKEEEDENSNEDENSEDSLDMPPSHHKSSRMDW